MFLNVFLRRTLTVFAKTTTSGITFKIDGSHLFIFFYNPLMNRGGSRNFQYGGGATLFKKKSGGAWAPTHSQEPHFCKNKAVLEPRVSPAFASTYFCNHCNIRFENTSKYVDTLILFSKNLNQRSLTPT